MEQINAVAPRCADCGCEIGQDDGPPDGWQLEDGRTVCQDCCVIDTKAKLGINVHKVFKIWLDDELLYDAAPKPEEG